MNYVETPMMLPCAGDELVAIATIPAPQAHSLGLLVVVGGPQYRVGSHRQFVMLSRRLAGSGIASMRFDYRGMGDATGAARAFEKVDEDIRVAIDAFQRAVPSVSRVVLWGLCDGASAACLYAPGDPRVAGLILVNPWVRTPAGEATTMLKQHYAHRLVDRQFWAKLLSGRVAVAGAARDVIGAAMLTIRRRRNVDRRILESLPQRMARALSRSNAPFALALSGRDFVAGEFDHVLAASSEWAKLASVGQCVAIERLPQADHTLSRAEWQDAVAERSIQWINRWADTATGVRQS